MFCLAFDWTFFVCVLFSFQLFLGFFSFLGFFFCMISFSVVDEKGLLRIERVLFL